MARLIVCQALWGMINLAGVDLQRDMDGAVDRIAEAGFDGLSCSLLDPQVARAAARARARGLVFIADGFVRTSDGLEQAIQRAVGLSARHLNIQILARPPTFEESLDLMNALQGVARAAPLPVFFETHRGRLTNDLAQTVRLTDAIADLRLTADLSHYCVAHEFMTPPQPADVERISRILARTGAFHGRVGATNQVQAPLEAPHFQVWVDQFKAWWLEGFQSWRARAPGADGLVFVCELGPPPYAVTAPDGRELTDRWAEALLMASWVRDLWAGLEGGAPAQIPGG